MSRPFKIMPLGDSITFGDGSTDLAGYRSRLFARALADGKAITFVGSETSGPAKVDGVAFPADHEGYSGFTIGALTLFTANTIATHRPHIVTLMIGTNDLAMGTDIAMAKRALEMLVDPILAADPNLLLLLAQITPTADDTRNTRTQAYNAAVADVVQARIDIGKRVALVDMYSAFVANERFKTAWLNDGLHPNDAGYGVMADVWYAAIAPLLR